MRLAEQRGHAHVGREHLAVAVEDVGPRGRDRILADRTGARWCRRSTREHHQPAGDHRIADAEHEDRQADARARLGRAVDVLARRAACAPAGDARLLAWRALAAAHVGAAGGLAWPTSWLAARRRMLAVGVSVTSGFAITAPIGSAGSGGTRSRRPLRQIVERVDLPRIERLAAARCRCASSWMRAGLSSFAHSARSAAMASCSRRISMRSLATRCACRVDSNLIL